MSASTKPASKLLEAAAAYTSAAISGETTPDLDELLLTAADSYLHETETLQKLHVASWNDLTSTLGDFATPMVAFGTGSAIDGVDLNALEGLVDQTNEFFDEAIYQLQGGNYFAILSSNVGEIEGKEKATTEDLEEAYMLWQATVEERSTPVSAAVADLSDAKDKCIKSLETLADTINDKTKTIYETGIAELVEVAKDKLEDAFVKAFSDYILDVLPEKGFIARAVNLVKSAINNLNNLLKGLSGAWDKAKEKADELVNEIKKYLGGVVQDAAIKEFLGWLETDAAKEYAIGKIQKATDQTKLESIAQQYDALDKRYNKLGDQVVKGLKFMDEKKDDSIIEKAAKKIIKFLVPDKEEVAIFAAAYILVMTVMTLVAMDYTDVTTVYKPVEGIKILADKLN